MTFYQSKQWQTLRQNIILKQLQAEGEVRCWFCHKPIIDKYDIIAHHVIPIEKDKSLAFAEDNIVLVHHNCHNIIHARFGTYDRHIYIVHGAPFAGKHSFVFDRCLPDDLIVDIDAIYQAICPTRSGRLLNNVMELYRHLIDMVTVQNGKWVNAWIIRLLPYKAERERLAAQTGGELIHIDTDFEECIKRADGKTEIVEDYFRKFQA